jgi:tryptophan synthase alpha chain
MLKLIQSMLLHQALVMKDWPKLPLTGARESVSSGAEALVTRIRAVTDLPVAVGLGVSTREQAKDLARYADGIIVGSAFVKAILDAPTIEAGLAAVTELAQELALGVRGQ